MAQPQVVVFSADDVENVPMLSDSQTFTGTNTFTQQIVSTLATGTSPLAVASATKVSNMNVDQVDGADLDTDGTLAANSDVKVPSQKAVKTYVTASIPSVPVSSVFSRTGAVTAQSGDYTASQVGLGNVTNDAQLKIASNLSDLANASTARTNLGVAIGTNVQAYDANLTTWAGKTAPSGTVVGTSDTQTLTGKTIQDIKVTVVSKSADYTASSSDSIIVVTASCTITIPTASSNTNRMLWIKYDNSGVGNLTIAAADNIDGAASKTVSTRYSTVGVFCNGTTWYITNYYTGGSL